MKRTQKNALAMAGLMTAATLFSAVPAMADDVITVDFWTAPQQVQYDYWEAKAQAFNETKTEVNGKIVEVKVQQKHHHQRQEFKMRLPQELLQQFQRISTEVLQQH